MCTGLTLVQLISDDDEEGYAGAEGVDHNGDLTDDTQNFSTHSTDHFLIRALVAHLKNEEHEGVRTF